MGLLIGNGTFLLFSSGYWCYIHLWIYELSVKTESRVIYLFIYLFIIYFCPCYDSRDLLDACFIYLSMFILLHYFLDAMKLNNPAVCDNNKNVLFNF